jgi:hypothetical protein
MESHLKARTKDVTTLQMSDRSDICWSEEPLFDEITSRAAHISSSTVIRRQAPPAR